MRSQTGGIVSLENAGRIMESSTIPLYLQLIQLVEKQLRKKKWQPGWSLPSEQAMCERFGLSRSVVRQALADFQQRGLLTKQNGKRTMIAYPSHSGSLMQKFTGFHEEAEVRWQNPRTKVLDFRVTKATNEVARNLCLPAFSEVIVLTRLRFHGSEPKVLVTTYLNYERCSPILKEDLTNKSLYRVLRSRLGLVMVKGTRTIRAVALSAREARLLRVAPKSPGLLLTSVGVLEDGTPLEYFISTHRGDNTEFEVQLTR
jgi:GntR family transcriptional regulator